jgi:hypothetical protein
MKSLTWRNRALAAMCVVITTCGIATAWAAEVPAAKIAPSTMQQAPQPVAPLPIFLTGTYLCSYNITDPCTGRTVATCSKVCNVGQKCHCAVQYGHGQNGCAIVKQVYPPSCI